MANEISYGLKFDTKDMERLLKLTKKLDEQMKLELGHHRGNEEERTRITNNEIKKREQRLRHQKAFEKQLRAIDLANEKKQQADITRIQKEEQRKRDAISAKRGNIREAITAPIARTGKYLATATVFYQGIAAAKQGMTAAMNYEQAMANTASALGKVTAEEKARMTQMALSTNIVNTYGMSALDVAQSFEVLAKAGLDAKESMQSFEPAMQLAKLSGVDLGTATEQLSQSLTELNMPMSYSQQLVDKLAWAADKSTVNIGDIAESFKIAAPVAKVYGMSINELTANIAMFGKAGLKGAASGNALARIMLRLKKDSANPDVIAAIKNNKTFTDVLIDLQKRGYTGLTEVQKEFGLYAGKNVTQFMNVAREAKNLTEQLDGGASVGSAMDKLNTIMDTTLNQINRMKSAWDNLFISGEGVNTIIGDMAGGLADLFNAMKEFPEATKAVMGLTAAFTALGVALATTNPFYAAAAGIAAVGSASLIAWENIRKMNEEVAKSAGFLPNEDFSSAEAVKKTDTEITARYSKMSAEQLQQEKYKLLGQKKLYDEFYKELYEKYAHKSLWSMTLEDRKKEAELIKKYTGVIVTSGDQYTKFEKEAKKRQEGSWKAGHYLTLLSGIKPITDESMTTPPPGTVPPKGAGGAGAGKSEKQRIDDLDDFLRSLDKLRNGYSEKELTGLQKTLAEIENTYKEHYEKLKERVDNNKENNVKTLNEETALRKIEIDKQNSLLEARYKYQKEMEDKALSDAEKRAEEISQANIKAYEEEKKARLEAAESLKSALEQYGSINQKLDMDKVDEETEIIKAQNDAKILGIKDTEELITNIRQEHYQARIDMAYEAWSKEHEIAMNFMSSMSSGWSSLAQGLSDDLQISKDESEQIWDSMKSTFIQGAMDIAASFAMAALKAAIFGDTAKTTVPDAATTTAGYAAMVGGIITSSIAAAVATPIFDSMGVALGAATFGANYIAAAGARSAYQSMGSITDLLGGGKGSLVKGLPSGGSLADAIVADGKVYPYRKDDLVLAIGTGLESKSGAKLPTQIGLPQFNSNNGNNVALIAELRSLRMAVASGNAQISKAVADNRPIVQGKFLDNVDVYKAATKGGKQANFVVNNNK